MKQLSEMHWIQRFYRVHLARYRWAAWLKSLYLILRLFLIQSKNFIVWQVVRSAMFLTGRHFFSWHRGMLAKCLDFFSLRLLDNKITVYLMSGFSQYIESSNANHRELAPPRKLLLSMPNVYPKEFNKYFYGRSWMLQTPPITAFEVSKAQVMGKSDFLFLDNQCLHHELYHFDQDFLFEEMHDIVSINAANKIMIRFKGHHVGSISSGISLVGSATSNYVHWLTETLPKLALVDGIDAYRDMPYIIDAGLHPNILESMRHLNSGGRNVIKLGRGEILTVDKLVAISPVAYVPFDFKPGIKQHRLDINPGSALYSPDGLQRVRQSAVTCLGEVSGVPKRRLFLRRAGISRPMNNSIEVEAMVREHGFEIIEPETLNFADQVRLFSNTELIVSQGGAALGNIIFAPAGCHVIVITTWSPYTVHYYFSNLAALLGQRCTLIMCEPVQSDLGPHRAHMGVNVSIQTLIKAIQQ
jgi:hypothetical protein